MKGVVHIHPKLLPNSELLHMVSVMALREAAKKPEACKCHTYAGAHGAESTESGIYGREKKDNPHRKRLRHISMQTTGWSGAVRIESAPGTNMQSPTQPNPAQHTHIHHFQASLKSPSTQQHT